MAQLPAHAQAFLAPAKLNLDLRIIGRRADGYHLLESIFCLIDLCDIVHLAPRTDAEIILHTPAAGVAAEQDLSYRAAKALQQAANCRLGADIWLQKNIPMGGGLGGGSSDAATVLLALNHLWQCGLNRQALMEIGVGLGADVPFFLFGRNAFAKGIGEQLSAFAVPKQWYVVVKPAVHVSTPAIFSHRGLTRNSKPSIMPTFQTLQPFRNDMQAVVLETYPEVKEVYQALKPYGKPLMTGSGACVFIGFEQKGEAEAVYNRISKKYEAYCVEGLEAHPLLDR